MAKPESKDFVDISSSADVKKVYGKEVASNGGSNGSKKNKKGKKSKAGVVLRVFTLIFSIIFLFAGITMVFGYNFIFGIIDSVKYKDIDNTPVPTSPVGATTDYAVVSGGATPLSSDNVLNILLFGQDTAASKDDYGRSDTTILLSIDNVNKKLKLTSFQRDTLVHIPGFGDDKINAAFTFGGEALSSQTIESNFGIKVDKYATVDFSSFREVIEALGGVDIELTKEEIEYINAQIDVNHQTDRTSFLKYDATKEKQVMHLDGYQALWYARDRGEESLGGNPEYSFSGDDWDRTSRQRNLIMTIVKHLKESASLPELVDVANKIGPLITTNLNKGDMTFLVTNMLTYMRYEMEEISMPTTDNWSYGHTSDGQSVIVITDWDAVRKDAAKFIFEDAVVTN